MTTDSEEPAQATEIRRRVLEVDNGDADLIDHEVVMSEARADLAWTKEALRRLDEIESGREEAIDADGVFAELGIDAIRKRVENIRSGKAKTINGPTGLAQVRRAVRN